MTVATNPTTGESVYLDDATGQWLPAQTAINPDTGEKAIFDGKAWVPHTAPGAAPPATPPPASTYQSPEADQGLRERIEPPAGVGFNANTAKLAGQAAGSGGISTLMLPVDLPGYLQRGVTWGMDKLTDPIFQRLNQAAGKTIIPTSLERSVRNPQGLPLPGSDIPIPSEKIKEGASWLAQKLGYQPAVPETLGEKALSHGVELGTGAFTGAGLLSKIGLARKLALEAPGALPSRIDKYVRPYAENPVKTIIGDTVGGVGAGEALTATQEIPQNIRDMGGGSVGTIADLVGMGVGGVTSGTLASAGMRTPTTLGNAVTAPRPAFGIPVDPVTKAGVSNRVADDTARLLQGSVTSGKPQDVAANLAAAVEDLKSKGLPIPTTDIAIDDKGLAGLGKRQRTRAGPTGYFDADTPPDVRQQYSFAERDLAQKEAASQQVQSVRDPNADTELFQNRVADRARMELEARQREIDQPTGGARGLQQAREAEAQPVIQAEGGTPDASKSLYDMWHGTRAAEQTRSQALYANPDFTEHSFNIGSMERAAADIRRQAAEPGSAPINARTEDILQRIESAQETGTLTGKKLSEMNKDIEAYIEASLKDGQRFQELKDLKNSIANAITDLPRPHPAREAITAARTNTAEVIDPNFRQFASGKADLAEKTNPGQVYPSEFGPKALARGEDVQQTMNVAGLRGNTPEAAANARTIIFDELAQSGAIKDGVLDPAKLTSWRNRNNDRIQNVPGLADEVNNMVASARRGSNTAGQYAEEIAAAEKRLAETKTAQSSGVVGKIAGENPVDAVSKILTKGGTQSAKDITELRNRMGNNPEAVASLKAAVADHFSQKVSRFDPALDDATHAADLRKLVGEFNKNRPALVAAGFTPEELNTLQQAQTVLLPLTRRNVQATVGSTTAESNQAVMKPLELALKVHYGTLKGGSVFRNIKIAAGLLKGDTGTAVEQLATRAMFDPDLAQKLLTRDVSKSGTPAWNAELQKVLRRNQVLKDLVKDDGTDDGEDKAK